MKTPERTTAAAFHRYVQGHVLADSATLRWPGLIVRQSRYPRVVDRFLVPATPEPLIVCNLSGAAEFQERDVGGAWITRRIKRGDLFVTRSRAPYEVHFSSPAGQEIENISIHVAIDAFRAALEQVHRGKADTIEVVDFFGRDPALAHLCFACVELLAERVPGKSKRVAALTELFASCLAEKYTVASSRPPELRGGLPIRQLHKIEEHVAEHLAQEISVEALAQLVELSPFHFSRVFKQTTGMPPLQFVTRERITRAQQLLRETKQSVIEIALEVGYTSPSHFAQVFRRATGITPLEFRATL